MIDGPVNSGLERVIDSFQRGPLRVRRVDLLTRRGAGPARQAGLGVVQSRWVAIADADDISLPHRLATQSQLMADHGLDIAGSSMIEFGNAVSGQHQVRHVPSTEQGIVRRLRMNNPFNHPTVMMSTSRARDAGGYRDLPFLEDYDLVARMIAAGAKPGNTPEPLVRFRMDVQTLRRRSSLGAALSELSLQRQLIDLGFISWRRAVLNFLIRNGYRIAPRDVQRLVNTRILSRRGGQA